MRGDVAAGVFVAAFVVLVYSVTHGLSVLTLLSVAVIIGVLVTNVASHQMRGGSDQAKPRQGKDRPWRRDPKA